MRKSAGKAMHSMGALIGDVEKSAPLTACGGTSRAGGLQPPGPRKVPSRAARAHALGEASPRGGAPILFKARRAGSTGQARRFLFYLQYTTDKGKRKQTGVGLPVGYLMSGPLARRGAHPVEGGHRSHKQPRGPSGADDLDGAAWRFARFISGGRAFNGQPRPALLVITVGEAGCSIPARPGTTCRRRCRCSGALSPPGRYTPGQWRPRRDIPRC